MSNISKVFVFISISLFLNISANSVYAFESENYNSNDYEQNEYIPMTVPEYYKYDYVNIETVTRSFKQFADGQPLGGRRWETGGGLYHADSGGTPYSFSVSFAAGTPYSISVAFGFASTVNNGGIYASAPNNVDYFKLQVTKIYQITKIAVYGYPTNGGPRKFLYYIYSELYIKPSYAMIKGWNMTIYPYILIALEVINEKE